MITVCLLVVVTGEMLSCQELLQVLEQMVFAAPRPLSPLCAVAYAKQLLQVFRGEMFNSVDTGLPHTSLQAKDDSHPNVTLKFPPPFVKCD
ncbi:hypothetical protein AVEN_39587-1 [Araneus ventricosus]|uniref:Secreted protein n=1 Tax=Araneus ventricosus TaxID=182803 RepID=A0A4Y2HL10_ARAVE|nr:hypothetical protein AVEN_39587-1 [Araneus ventricosus]